MILACVADATYRVKFPSATQATWSRLKFINLIPNSDPESDSIKYAELL